MVSSRHRTVKPEIWAGMEATINRVQDQYHDQFDRTGQYEQMDDLREACKLGISKLRFPILWERHHDNPPAWEHTSKQLDLLDKYSVEPIAGLLHHGSGPFFTNLADPAFPELFAGYAKKVAMAYPRIKYYTPVNEPLTTARFSGLYGFWYPHGMDERTFAAIFLNQLKAIVLSMQAIREINPDAQLIQTEDLCKVHSTRSLQYQANFENERRWWTYDFLTSKVTESHAAWNYFIAAGIPDTELQFFAEHPCIPAIAGFNYYVTSERYLDENIHGYWPALSGGNGYDKYVDTEAARSGHAAGLKILLKEAWDRYHIPMAVTECHLNCTREQQLRWLDQQWKSVRELNEHSIPVLAITVWALMGAYDWNSLVTQKNNYYESGAFKLSAVKTTPTALTCMIRAMSAGEVYEHPVLPGKGWWEAEQEITKDARPMVVLGGSMILHHCNHRFLDVINTENARDLHKLIVSRNVWAVVTNEDNEEAAMICREMDTPFFYILDNDKIDETLDFLIDQQALHTDAKKQKNTLIADRL